MQYSAEAGRPPMFLNHVQAIGPSVTAMDDDGLLRPARQIHLLAENTRLRFARRMIVKIIEPDLPPSDDFRMLSQPCQFFQVLWCSFLRFVGVNSNRGENPVMLFGKGQRGIELLGSRAGSYGKQRRDAGSSRAFKHGVAVLRELREVDVRV